MDEGHLGWVCELRVGGLLCQRAHLQEHLSIREDTYTYFLMTDKEGYTRRNTHTTRKSSPMHIVLTSQKKS